MRILVIAASCSPYKGSEPSLGWKVSLALAASHEVHAVVLSGHQSELERAKAEGLIPPTLQFHFHGPNWNELPASDVEKGFWWNSYRSFLGDIRQKVTLLHQEHHFDLIHHITFASWRLPVPLYDMGIPFVWGPIGGAEKFPPGFLSILSFKAAGFEIARYAGNLIGSLNPRLRKAVKNTHAVVASNPEAYELLSRLRLHSEGLHLLLVTSFTPKERQALGTPNKPPRRDPHVLHAFASGALEGRKGVSLAIEAIALAKKRGLKIRYRVGSHGPEIDHLREQVKHLGLQNDVVFGEPLPRDGYVRELLESDVYLLPSLRDNAPSTLMEAMLAGCVPVVAACGGPNVIVSDECGYRISVKSRKQLVTELAEALLKLQSAPDAMRAMGLAARERILEHYTIESYLQRIEEIYQDAIANHASQHKTQS